MVMDQMVLRWHAENVTKTVIKRNKGQYPPNIKKTTREREKTILNIPTNILACMK
jgi:hypothetical protein